MFQAIGIVELKSIAVGIEATDATLKSANVKLVSAHPSCPGKYEILLTGGIADVSAAVDHIKGKFESSVIDAVVLGRIDPQVQRISPFTRTRAKRQRITTRCR